ncbi:Protein NLP2 [Phytophthora citrophthora]|uniref:Protein NLP2 n=1 Tax=Phytophthora citrophthora TaxID=4793 RepID=A0AAD9G4H8_9STRA|nr:Protein NLP2 [Phytophthora citrophthora]
MEAFAIAPSAKTSVSLPPLTHKRQLSSINAADSPVKRCKLSEPVSSPDSTSSVGSTSSKSRPNMTASSSITLDMLRPHFEEPLAKVAASFGICVTLLKKICRRHGIARWPHRQITGLRKSIASMEHAIGYFDGARRESYAEQLLKQKNKLAALLEDPTTSNPLLANEDDSHVERVRRTAKVPVARSYEVAPVSMARASSPTGPLLAESPYQGPSSVAISVQPSPMWLPTPQTSYVQKYQQLCPPPKLEHSPTTSYYTPSVISVGSTPVIHLPPLRRESRAVLPPISSLVVGNNSAPMSRW